MIPPAEIQVRFSDCDMMGHVNNAMYLSYFEMARIHYFGHLLGSEWDWRRNGVLLRKNEVEYLKPLLLHENPKIHVFTQYIGNKSFTMAYELMVDGEIRTTGSSVLVCFDAVSNTSIEMNHALRAALEKLKR